MRILVTGGFGYLGGRIAKSLSEQGHQLVLGSRDSQCVPNWLPQSEVVQTIWGDSKSLLGICDGVDAVIHTAGVNAKDCILNPVEAIEFNGVATARLVNASIFSGVSKFIYLSTTHVYGSPLEGEITENSCLLNKHPYATSHVAGENVVLYQDNPKKNLRTLVLRLSNGVGTPVHKDVNCWMLAVNDFCRQVIENARIEINSPRDVVRDFVPISVLCNMVNMLVLSDRVDDNIFNISSAKTISLQNIAEIIMNRSEKVIGFTPEIVYKNKDLIGKKNNLIISNAKLINSINLNSNLEIEIDKLLLNCKHWFG